MKQYTTLLFDADGTLFDFEMTEQQALQQTFQRYGYPYDEHIKKRYLEINRQLWDDYEEGRMSREDVIYTRFGRLFNDIGIHDDGIAFEDDYQKALGRGHELMEHAMEVVSALSNDFDLYVVTNGVVETQYQRLKDAHLRAYFKDVFVSEELGYRKPQREYFDYCFAHIQENDKKRILIIGDSLSSDMLGGIHAGIDTCWFNPAHKADTKQLALTYEIKDLRDIYKITGKDVTYE